MARKDELVACTLKPDRSNRCRVAFAAKDYATGGNGLPLDAKVFRIVDAYLPDRESRTAHQFYHYNHCQAVAENVEVNE